MACASMDLLEDRKEFSKGGSSFIMSNDRSPKVAFQGGEVSQVEGVSSPGKFNVVCFRVNSS